MTLYVGADTHIQPTCKVLSVKWLNTVYINLKFNEHISDFGFLLEFLFCGGRETKGHRLLNNRLLFLFFSLLVCFVFILGGDLLHFFF